MAARIVLGNLTIDRERYEVWVGRGRVDLTYVEFELLYQLAKSPAKVLVRARLLNAIWGEDHGGQDRKLNVHISRLRKKLHASVPWRIATFPRRGYALVNRSAQRGPAARRLSNSSQSSGA